MKKVLAKAPVICYNIYVKRKKEYFTKGEFQWH